MLETAPTLVIGGLDTAEKEPSKVSQNGGPRIGVPWARCLHYDLIGDKKVPDPLAKRGLPESKRFTTVEIFASPEALERHKNMWYVTAWGKFQYDKESFKMEVRPST